MDKPGYVAKPETCKAKTADDPRCPYAGLVVNPFLCRNAFTQASRRRAEENWRDFADGDELPPGYKMINCGAGNGAGAV